LGRNNSKALKRQDSNHSFGKDKNNVTKGVEPEKKRQKLSRQGSSLLGLPATPREAAKNNTPFNRNKEDVNFFGRFARASSGLPAGADLLVTPKGGKTPMNIDMLTKNKSTDSVRSIGGTRMTRQMSSQMLKGFGGPSGMGWHHNFAAFAPSAEIGGDTPMEMLTGKQAMKVGSGNFGQLGAPDVGTMQQF